MEDRIALNTPVAIVASPTTHRDASLDFLRGIAILCVILAHVHPPDIVFQIRNFDVPLLLMVAGAAFSLRAAQHPDYWNYLLSRVIRLVVPVWVFLAVFLFTTLLVFSSLGKPYPFTPWEILSSFALMSGIGYVWVVRVFLLVAIIAPLMTTHLPRAGGLVTQSLILIALFAAYETLVWSVSWPDVGLTEFLFEDVLYYLVPYSTVFLIGTRIGRMRWMHRKGYLVGAGICLSVAVSFAAYFLATTGTFVPTQQFKYPPTLYYLSYALSVSFLLYYFASNTGVSTTRVGRLIGWLGRNTMWIYLWHIALVYAFKWTTVSPHFALDFLIMLAGSTLLVLAQQRLLDYVQPAFTSDRARRIAAKVFTG